MKVITDSHVEVVHKSQFQEHSTYKLPPDGTDVERIGAFCAKSCYDSFGEDGRSCVDNQRQIIEYLHGSVLEHSSVGLFIEGVTRALTLELNRHRPFSISQRSTRYTEEEDSAIVLEPYYASIWNKYDCALDKDGYMESPLFPEIDDSPEGAVLPAEYRLLESFVSSCNTSISQYGKQVKQLVELNPNNLKGFDLRKWARGKARNILPHALETRGTWTMNFRGWRWFIQARSSRHAEPEIRRLAEKILAILRPIAPVYFDDFHLTGIYDGIPEFCPKYHKI